MNHLRVIASTLLTSTCIILIKTIKELLMQMTRKQLAVFTVAFALLLSHGCKKEAEPQESLEITEAGQAEPGSGGDNQSVAGETSISDLVSLWTSGEKDEATETFLSINWQDATTLNQIRGLSISEEDMKSLSEDEIKSIVGETMPLLGSMRKLFFHIAAEAERLAASGELTKAKEYLIAVKEYGNSLSESNHLQIVQTHGTAAKAYAAGKLSQIK
jgi:hypothetical protein